MSLKGRVKLLATAAIAILAIAPMIRACDTWVALPDATRGGVTLLGKNSDRAVFDSGPLMFYPRQQWPAGSQVNVGRLTIPQVEETYRTLGSSPYWCWGYEEGINEYGVAIGNEGVSTRVLTDEIAAQRDGQGPKEGLTGMDLVRLGLERGKTAREALEVITQLLETYGQFGPGLPTLGLEGAYDNSYIIADAREAWVLETAGTKWVARRSTSGFAVISNVLSITTAWDAASPDLVDYAVARGWWPADSIAVFDFARAYADETGLNRDRAKGARTRAACSSGLLGQSSGQIDVPVMMRIARDQTTTPSIDLDVTASSCVAVLPDAATDFPVFWWCPTRPSNSCYVPFFVHADRLPAIVSAAGTYGKRVTPPDKAEKDAFSPDSYWWQARDLCDKTNAAWDTRHPLVRAEFDQMEKAFETELPGVLAKATELREQGKPGEAATMLGDFTDKCLTRVLDKIKELREKFAIEVAEVPDLFKPFVGSYVGNFGPFKEAVFKVVVQNGRLAVDIPAQAVVELKEPDDKGLRHLVLTDAVAVAFDQDAAGNATAMNFHQATEMPKKTAAPDSDLAGVTDDYKPYVGKYSVPPGIVEIAVLVEDGKLALQVPSQDVVQVNPPDEDGRWHFVDDPDASISFDRDGTDRVTKMTLRQVFSLPRAISP